MPDNNQMQQLILSEIRENRKLIAEGLNKAHDRINHAHSRINDVNVAVSKTNGIVGRLCENIRGVSTRVNWLYIVVGGLILTMVTLAVAVGRAL